MAAEPPTPTKAALQEAVELADEVLGELELAEAPLAQVALKAARMARLAGHAMLERLCQFEASGYPNDGPLPADVFQLALIAGRKIKHVDPSTNEESERVYVESVAELEARKAGSERLLAQSTIWVQQNQHTLAIQKLTRQLATSRATLHRFVRASRDTLKFAGVAENAFIKMGAKVSNSLGSRVPNAMEHLAAITDNLESVNPEDWANAVHSCRRLLKDLADAIYPARDAVEVDVGGEKKTVELGEEQYLNRLVTFVSMHSESDSFEAVVGSHLTYLVDRLESIYAAANKGTHARVTKEDAERYVIYMYMIVGDILSLEADSPVEPAARG